jgi:hypothetical protein
MSQYSEDDYRDAASSLHVWEQAEVDGNAPVSLGDDDGAYVQAWVWVSDDQMRRLGYEPSAEKGENEGDEGTDDEDHEGAADRADPEEHRGLAGDAQQTVQLLDVQPRGEGDPGGANEVEGAEGGRQPGVTNAQLLHRLLDLEQGLDLVKLRQQALMQKLEDLRDFVKRHRYQYSAGRSIQEAVDQILDDTKP